MNDTHEQNAGAARVERGEAKAAASEASCCSATEQATCCEPSQKSACCGAPDAAAVPVSRCGCR